MTALIIFGLLILLMATGMPVSIALGFVPPTYFFGFTDENTASIGLKLFKGIEKFEIMAIPFFILAGNFLTTGGAAAGRVPLRLDDGRPRHVRRPGSRRRARHARCSRPSPAIVGRHRRRRRLIILPAMKQGRLQERFSAGVIAPTSGALGILFPPSINLVIFAIATNGMEVKGPHGESVSSASVGDLFIAGVVPGLVLAVLLGVTTWWRARKYDYPREVRATWLARTLEGLPVDAFWGIFADRHFVIGGIYSGPVHADRGGRRWQPLCSFVHLGLRLQGP